MFIALIGFLLEMLGEVVIQFIIEILVEMGATFFTSFKRSRLARMPVAALGLVIVGGFVGYVSALVLPHRLFPTAKYSGISLFLAPLVTGIAMHFYGSWRQDKGQETTLLSTFWGGALFAFCMALARWFLIGRWDIL